MAVGGDRPVTSSPGAGEKPRLTGLGLKEHENTLLMKKEARVAGWAPAPPLNSSCLEGDSSSASVGEVHRTTVMILTVVLSQHLAGDTSAHTPMMACDLGATNALSRTLHLTPTRLPWEQRNTPCGLAPLSGTQVEKRSGSQLPCVLKTRRRGPKLSSCQE